MARSTVSVWILPDQLNAQHSAQAWADSAHGRSRVRVLLVDIEAWLQRLTYHRKRQALILSSGRYFSEELRARGYSVELIAAEDGREGLARHL